METRVREQVLDRAYDSSYAVGCPADRPRSRHLDLFLFSVMPDHKTMCEENIAWVEIGHLQSQRVEQHFLQGFFIWLAGDDFNYARSDIETGVVVRPDLSERLDLRKSGDLLHHFVEGVIAISKVIEIIADPAAGVRQQMTDRHFLCHAFIGESEIRNVGAHRRIQVNFALLGEHHQQRAGEGFADGADLHQSVWCDREWMLHTGNAETSRPFPAFVVNTDGGTGNFETLHLFLDFF